MRRLALAAACMILLFVPAIRADIVYDNGAPPPPPDKVSGNEMTHWIQADEFVLPTDTTITGIHFWAWTPAPGPYFDGSVTWQIYDNNGTQPGNLLSWGNVMIPNATPTGKANSGFANSPEYVLDFNITPFAASAGTEYWLGLHNGPLTDKAKRGLRSGFYWETTTVVTQNPLLSNPQEQVVGDTTWSDQYPLEHAFSLIGTVDSVPAVPEPSAIILMLTVLGGVAVLARRRWHAAESRSAFSVK